MWVVRRRPGGCVPKASRHSEVNQENTTTLEPKNQILAAALNAADALPDEPAGDVGGFEGPDQARIEDRDVLDAAADERGVEPRADCLDFGQLRHSRSVALGSSTAGAAVALLPSASLGAPR